MSEGDALEALLQEGRTFPPPESFRKTALDTDASVYDEAERDWQGFWAAQALALGEDRTYCIPDDIKRLVVPVFAHRIVVSSRFSSSLRRSEEAEAVLNEILKTVSVPL